MRPYTKSSALGARHQREDLSAGYAPRKHPATIVENAKALVLGTRQTRQHSETIDKTRDNTTLTRINRSVLPLFGALVRARLWPDSSVAAQ